MNSLFHVAGAAIFIFCCSMISANTQSRTNQPIFVNDFFQQEFQDLQQKIADSKVLGKTKAGEHGGAILDSQALIFSTDRDPLDVVLRRTGALLADLKKSGAANLDRFEAGLNNIKASSNLNGLAKTANAPAVRQDLYLQAMALQRQVALANPIIDFDSLLFVAMRIPTVCYQGHIVGEFQGCIFSSGNIGGDGQGLFMVKGIKSGSPSATNIVANTTIQNGRLKGKKLMGGAFLSAELSYDGKTIVFDWREPGGGTGGLPGGDDAFRKEFDWHIMRVDVDGSNCMQLTDGDYSDFHPCWLPNGRIAFVTERRRGFGRCHGWQGRTFTIFSMKDDGSDMYCIDYHETNEWKPSVDNNGKIVYSRWDYVDRDAIVAHNMWIMYPDGRDSRSWHGNYPSPWSTIPGSLYFGTHDGRLDRPMTELYIRSIPGSERYVATVMGHHTYPYGDLILIDLNVPDDGKNSQITGLTTNRTTWYDESPQTYGTTWPLSESYYLCSYKSDIVLLDKSGNSQTLFTSSKAPGVSGGCRCADPMPFRPRKSPPVIPIQTFQGERKSLPEHKRAVISVMNVYNADIPLPPGVKIKEFRIVQLVPKSTMAVDNPRTNYASQALCRMSLGTAPVESDGSVYCEAPTGKTLYFQILDDRGCAIQSMRSASWVHDGEHLTCAGCHENKWKSTPTGQPLAMQRAPSPLKPEYGDSVEPLTYYRSAKPVLDAQCAPCHKKQGKGPDMSYGSLKNYAFCYDGPQDQIASAPGGGIYHGSRTTPGKHGALQSQLFSHLDSTHHDVKLTAEQKRRITYWLDCGSMELGAYTRVGDQQAGKIVWPELDCDPANPQGVEIAFSSPGATTIKEGAINLSFDNPLEMRVDGTVISLVNPNKTDVRISLFDLGGRCVFTKVFRQHDARLSMDARNWPMARGIYVAKAFEGKSSASVIAPIVY